MATTAPSRWWRSRPSCHGGASARRCCKACTARFGNVWLVTTNDNVDAQRFFLAAGGRRVAVHAGAVTLARRLKPGIPTTGHGGVPITDEIEFAWAAQPPGTC